MGEKMNPVKRNGKYEYFQSSDGWHWNKIGGNGEITSSGEAHTTKGGCIAAIGRDMDDSSGYDIRERAPVVVGDDIEVRGASGVERVDY